MTSGATTAERRGRTDVEDIGVRLKSARLYRVWRV